MATGTPIKIVDINGTLHEILAKYIQDADGNPKTWADILAAAAEAGISLVSLASLPTANAETYATYRKSLVFVPSSNPGTQNIKDEYIIQRTGTEGSYSYSWEQIGSTELDLSGYVEKRVNYAGAAQSNGAHTHTVTVPTVSVDKTKKLGATASGTGVIPRMDTFVKSYPGVTSKLVTSTASKATAGTAKTVTTNGIKSASLSSSDTTSTGAIKYTEEVGTPTLTGTKTFNTDAIKSAALTGTTTFAVQPTVDANGVLSFPTASVGISTAPASTGTVGILTPAPTYEYLKLNTTASDTDTITPYTFADVTVATGSLAANGSGDSVMIGLGTASTGSAVISVAVENPTITITEDTTNTGPVNEHVTTDTASATTSSDGAHTHDLYVTQ